MADYAVWNPEQGRFELLPPLIPVQEVHKPHESLNPAFELEQWRMGLRIALLWAKRLGLSPAGDWLRVADNMAPLPEKDGLYLAQ
jgi:hypothetical protein